MIVNHYAMPFKVKYWQDNGIRQAILIVLAVEKLPQSHPIRMG